LERGLQPRHDVSGAIVALALVAQVTAFGEGFATFALLILPVVLFVGVATFLRLVAINREDVAWVVGMNLLRLPTSPPHRSCGPTS
jgi:hypothetical protein